MSPIAILALLIALVFSLPLRGGSSRRLRALGWLLVASWISFAAWEQYMGLWRSPTGDAAIRADIVLLWPMMVVLFVVGVIYLFRSSRAGEE